jgi:hypothetical protein
MKIRRNSEWQVVPPERAGNTRIEQAIPRAPDCPLHSCNPTKLPQEENELYTKLKEHDKKREMKPGKASYPN